MIARTVVFADGPLAGVIRAVPVEQTTFTVARPAPILADWFTTRPSEPLPIRTITYRITPTGPSRGSARTA